MKLSALRIILLALLSSALSSQVMALSFEESNKIIGEALTDCTPVSVEFEHPLMDEMETKTIKGMSDGKCAYVETIPGGAKLTCHYPAEYQQVVSQFIIDFTQQKLGQYVIDGEKTDNPFQVAIQNNICTMSDS